MSQIFHGFMTHHSIFLGKDNYIINFFHRWDLYLSFHQCPKSSLNDTGSKVCLGAQSLNSESFIKFFCPWMKLHDFAILNLGLLEIPFCTAY